MQIGDVPDVDDTEKRLGGVPAACRQQTRDDLDGAGIVRSEHWAEDADRIDHRKFWRSYVSGDKIRRCPFGQNLDFTYALVCPVGSVQSHSS